MYEVLNAISTIVPQQWFFFFKSSLLDDMYSTCPFPGVLSFPGGLPFIHLDVR